jgi:hypothetical protein
MIEKKYNIENIILGFPNFLLIKKLKSLIFITFGELEFFDKIEIPLEIITNAEKNIAEIHSNSSDNKYPFFGTIFNEIKLKKTATPFVNASAGGVKYGFVRIYPNNRDAKPAYNHKPFSSEVGKYVPIAIFEIIKIKRIYISKIINRVI